MKRFIELISLIAWLLPHVSLAIGYLMAILYSGLQNLVLLMMLFPLLMVSFITLHSYADMSLDMDYMCEDGWEVGVKHYLNCFIFTVFCTLPIMLILSGVIFLASYLLRRCCSYIF